MAFAAGCARLEGWRWRKIYYKLRSVVEAVVNIRPKPMIPVKIKPCVDTEAPETHVLVMHDE